MQKLLLVALGIISVVMSGCFEIDKVIQRQMAEQRKNEKRRNAPKPWEPYKKVLETKLVISNIKTVSNSSHSARISGNVSQCRYLLETGEGYSQPVYSVNKVVRPGGWTDYVRGGIKKYDFVTRNTSKSWRDWMPEKITINNPFGNDAKLSVKADGSFSGNIYVKNCYFTKYPRGRKDDTWYRKNKNMLIRPYSSPHGAVFSYTKYSLTIWCSWVTAQKDSNAIVD